jgi:hypothetical protein
MSQVGDLLCFLTQHNLGHYTEILMSKGYTLDNLDKLTERDMRKLRITNKNESLKLVGLGSLIQQAKEKRERERQERLEAQQKDADSRKESVVDVADSGRASALSGRRRSPTKHTSATTSTANECCREATNYLQHHAVDRLWPTPGSKLAQDLALSTAAPRPPRKLYEVSLFERVAISSPRTPRPQSSPGKGKDAGRWEPTLKIAPHPPEDMYRARPLSARPHRVVIDETGDHAHGCSAKFCQICSEHVQHGSGAPGHWEYQDRTTVRIGAETLHEVEVWRPFKSIEMMKIDHAFMRGDPTIRVRRIKVNFEKMLWGKKPVRRRKGQMNFPSLTEKEIIRPHNIDENEKELAHLQAEYLESFGELLIAEEQLKRCQIWDQEAAAMNELRLNWRRKFELIFQRQRSDLESQEEEARWRLAKESNIDLNQMWERAGELAREERERRLAEEAEREAARQAALALAARRRREREFVPGDIEAPPRPVRTFAEIARDQLRMIEEMEAQRRALIEKIQAAEYANFVKISARINAQASTLLNCRTVNVSALTGLRCPKCLEPNCPFHKQPWHNHWRHRGGALDLKQPQVGYGTLASLLSHVNEVEYHEVLSGFSGDRSKHVVTPAKGKDVEVTVRQELIKTVLKD